MRNVIGLAFLALVLAFVAVQGASLVQSPTAAAVKGATLAETDARHEATQSPAPSVRESFPMIVFGPLVIAALCYLFVRKRV